MPKIYLTSLLYENTKYLYFVILLLYYTFTLFHLYIIISFQEKILKKKTILVTAYILSRLSKYSLQISDLIFSHLAKAIRQKMNSIKFINGEKLSSISMCSNLFMLHNVVNALAICMQMKMEFEDEHLWPYLSKMLD